MRYITINQKQHPVKFGFAALAEYCDLAGITLEQMSDPVKMQSSLTLMQCIKLCYVGLKFGAAQGKQPCAFDSWQQLAESLDNAENMADQILKQGLEAMAESVHAPVTNLDKLGPAQAGKQQVNQ